MNESCHMNILYFLTQKEDVHFLTSTDSVADCIEQVRRHSYTAVPVLSPEGLYCGTASDGDYLHFILEKNTLDTAVLSDTPIADIISPHAYKAVKITEGMETLLERITEQNFIPVTDDRNIFIGIIKRSDILKFLCKHKRI
jgi:CBS domain-containing protein